MVNTIVLNVYQMALGFPIPILLALIINEIRVRPLQKAIQNITYIPYFLSIVVIVSMLKLFSNPEYGLFNKIINAFYNIRFLTRIRSSDFPHNSIDHRPNNHTIGRVFS